MWLRYAYTSSSKTVKRIDLGRLPRGFLFQAPVTGTPAHGASTAAVPDFAALGVLDCLAKAALVSLFVDLGAPNLGTAADHVDNRLLAAFELAQDLIDEAFFHEGYQAYGDFHGRLLRCSALELGLGPFYA